MKETSVIIVAMAPNDHDHKRSMSNNNSDGAKQPRCKKNLKQETPQSN
jgi:hypothetical protein